MLALSLAITGIIYYQLAAQNEEDARLQFESEAEQSVGELRETMVAVEQVLRAGAGLLDASDTVSPLEWRRFVQRLDLPRAYRGIETVNFAERLRPEEIPALVEQMRARGNSEFRIWPEGARTEYIANLLVEPSNDQTREALGFDLLSEPTRRRAMEQARDSGELSLSGRVNLVVDQPLHPRPALLMFVPVFRHGSEPTTVEERRRELAGFVTATVRLDELVAGVLHDRTLPLSIAISEGAQFQPQNLIFTNGLVQDPLTPGRVQTLTTEIPLMLSDQRWTVRLATRHDTAIAVQGEKPLVALAAGIPLSLLLFGITWSEATLRARAKNLAKDMTRAIREQAELLDLTHDTVFLRDRTNVIRYWNRAASDAYGFSAEEAIGRTADDLLKTRFPIPLPLLWEELQRNDRWEGELVHTRRDGTEIQVASRWAVRRDVNGKIESILETNNDITDRRRAEEDRRRLEASLVQAQKLEALGTLAGGVAHDFNNILGAVLGYGELAQNAAPADTPLRRYIDNIMSAGYRAKSLVERILAFSRTGATQRVPVHVQSVVSEALDILGASLQEDIQLDRCLHAENAAVMGDATQIHQVVLNLCTNAAHAMKRFGGTLSVRLDLVQLDAPLTVITNTLEPGPYVRLQVQDSGVGIDPTLQARIFDPFFTTKGVGVGTGLGLSLVHGIVRDLGGGVDMASAMNCGTTFSVYLPHQGQPHAERTEDALLPQGNGETILLVDDEETLVRLGEEQISGLGYEAVGFTSGAEALEAFRTDPDRFAAVLSDETMPGMTGSQLAARIIAIRPDTPIILMSGYAGAALAAQARAAGARDVLGKPLDLRALARALASMFGNGSSASGAHEP